MNIPFTIEQFLSVFEAYNVSVWPAQIILNALAVVVIVLSFVNIKWDHQINSTIIGLFWIWMGLVYHLMHFTSINQAAYLFGILYILQGVLFIYAGVIRNRLAFQFQFDRYNLLGLLFITYALLIYPILGHVLGHVYPRTPTFGLPCPTTIFTFGILLWTNQKIPKYLLVIPFLWSLLGFSAAVSLTITEDFGLIVAGVIGCISIIARDRKLS